MGSLPSLRATGHKVWSRIRPNLIHVAPRIVLRGEAATRLQALRLEVERFSAARSHVERATQLARVLDAVSAIAEAHGLTSAELEALRSVPVATTPLGLGQQLKQRATDVVAQVWAQGPFTSISELAFGALTPAAAAPTFDHATPEPPPGGTPALDRSAPAPRASALLPASRSATPAQEQRPASPPEQRPGASTPGWRSAASTAGAASTPGTASKPGWRSAVSPSGVASPPEQRPAASKPGWRSAVSPPGTASPPGAASTPATASKPGWRSAASTGAAATPASRSAASASRPAPTGFAVPGMSWPVWSRRAAPGSPFVLRVGAGKAGMAAGRAGMQLIAASLLHLPRLHRQLHAVRRGADIAMHGAGFAMQASGFAMQGAGFALQHAKLPLLSATNPIGRETVVSQVRASIPPRPARATPTSLLLWSGRSGLQLTYEIASAGAQLLLRRYVLPRVLRYLSSSMMRREIVPARPLNPLRSAR